MQRLVVLGSTGSIGKNTLDILKRADGFSVIGLSCKENIDELEKQIKQFKPKYACVGRKELAEKLKRHYPSLKVFYGEKGLNELVTSDDVDFVVNALVGTVGLLPTYYTIEAGKKIALANKESLVIAGKILSEMADKKCIEIIPIDSEHSAIYQCLEGRSPGEVSKLILTASGGPFLNRDSFEDVSLKEALEHPNWNMGRKITIDSATMMNKGFEIIEARWLFGFPFEKIEVVIHRESIVHSAVEFIDGSIIAQIANHDMRIPIAYALFKPKRVDLPFKLDLVSVGKLTFEKPDFDRFVTLKLAYEALRKEHKNLGLVLNVADEVAVDLFLNGKIGFRDIFEIIQEACEKLESEMPNDILDVMEELERVRGMVEESVSRRVGG